MSTGLVKSTELFGLALQSHQSGDLARAGALYSQLLIHEPAHAEALHNLGVIATQMGRNNIAVDLIGKAIAIQPGWAAAHSNLGNILRKTGQLDESIAAYRRAISLEPELAEAYGNLGIALRAKGLIDEAIASYHRAISLRPKCAEFHNNLGNALAFAGEFAEAIRAFKEAIHFKPGYGEAYRNLGMALRDQGALDGAIAALSNAIALNPNNAMAHFDLAFTHLLQGNYAAGWKEYEWRWEANVSDRRSFAQPVWDGSSLQNKIILLYTEQGFGDVIQFLRFIPLLERQGCRIVIECPTALKILLQHQSNAWQVVASREPLPAFDVHCALLSLPLWLGTTLLTLPPLTPYFRADPVLIAKWQARIAPFSGSLKVGLVWAGNPAFKNDVLRSPRNLSLYAPLARVRGVQFFSLQKGDAATQAINPPTGMALTDWTHELHDFAETAALVANLDLIISSDTALVHLAGAIGKRVWVILPFAPDWRWLLHREDCAWYPTLRLFRQSRPHQWAEVMERVGNTLDVLATEWLST